MDAPWSYASDRPLIDRTSKRSESEASSLSSQLRGSIPDVRRGQNSQQAKPVLFLFFFFSSPPRSLLSSSESAGRLPLDEDPCWGVGGRTTEGTRGSEGGAEPPPAVLVESGRPDDDPDDMREYVCWTRSRYARGRVERKGTGVQGCRLATCCWLGQAPSRRHAYVHRGHLKAKIIPSQLRTSMSREVVQRVRRVCERSGPVRVLKE